MFIKPRAGIMIGIPFKCGCKPRGYVNQIYYGMIEEGELHTKKLLKAVSEGKFGEEWKKLLCDHPDGSVDFRYDLFVCNNCGNWANEEKLDFYLPIGEVKHKAVNFYLHDNKYNLHRKYTHICSKCGSVMEQNHLIDSSELCDNEPTYMAGIKNKLKIYNLHLKCDKCKKNIILLNVEAGIGKFSEYKPEGYSSFDY